MDYPPPPARAFRPAANEWLPQRAFLPPGTPLSVQPRWAPWNRSAGSPPRPRTGCRVGACAGSWDARALADDLAAGLAADRVYDPVDELPRAMQAQLATLAGSPAFPVWSRPDPTFKPRLSGFLATPQGTRRRRRVTVLLDTGATHCFFCDRWLRPGAYDSRDTLAGQPQCDSFIALDQGDRDCCSCYAFGVASAYSARLCMRNRTSLGNVVIAAVVIRDMCLRSGAGSPDALWWTTTPISRARCSSRLSRAGSCLVVGSAYHKNTNAKVEQAKGVISDTLRAYANGRKDDWDSHLTLAEFAIHNTASTLGDDLTPFFIDSGHPRLPLSPPHHNLAAYESSADYAQRMCAMEATVRELLAAAQADRKAKLDAGRVDTVFQVG